MEEEKEEKESGEKNGEAAEIKNGETGYWRRE